PVRVGVHGDVQGHRLAVDVTADGDHGVVLVTYVHPDDGEVLAGEAVGGQFEVGRTSFGHVLGQGVEPRLGVLGVHVGPGEPEGERGGRGLGVGVLLGLFDFVGGCGEGETATQWDP